MSKNLKDLRTRFIESISEVSTMINIPIADLTREDYVRMSVDAGIEGRLNKEELNLLGGFSFLKESIVGVKKLKKEQEELKRKQEFDRKSQFMVDTVIKMSQESGYIPTFNELKKEGISKKDITDTFGSYSKFIKNAEEVNGGVLSDFINENHFSNLNLDELIKKAGDSSRFIITTAVSGKYTDEDFISSLENISERKKAPIMVMPCQDISKRNKEFTWEIHRRLENHNLILNDLYLNDSIHLSSILVSAKQIHPLTGLDRLAQRKGSMILASPKQDLKYVANSNTKLPKALMTTGAVTLPEYFNDFYMSKRTSYLAEFDHVMGAILVEILDDGLFQFRQLQAGDSGEVIDLGVVYRPDGSIESTESIVVAGDSHVGAHDRGVDASLKGLCDEVNAKEILFHDLFDGRFNNHHNAGKVLTKAKIAEKGHNSLEKEGKIVADFLKRWSEVVPKLTIVKSNHDEVLDRFLDSARVLEDPLNLRLAYELSIKVLDGEDPLKYLLSEKNGLSNLNINWLERDQDYKVYKAELSCHGDLGANGSRGSLKSLEKAYYNAIVGHSHTAGILRNVKQVGTSSLLKLGYNRGPSSWTQTCCIEYPNGSFQLVNFIKKDGEVIYKLDV